MHRRPSTQDISWFLDLYDRRQLDLEPPYQRKSVWSPKDQKFFIDTIFRNYPSPAIFLHKTINDRGQSLYHVVDGKQRLTAILSFVDDQIAIANDFGDERLNGKKWSEITDKDIRQDFWNYPLTVEQIDYDESRVSDTVNHIFDRLNRNSKKLTNQELRHAKYDGWFYTLVESQLSANKSFWDTFKISTTARSKRMLDSQFIAELLILTINNGNVIGFDQQEIEKYYANYDDIESESESRVKDSEFDEDVILDSFNQTREYILKCNESNSDFIKYITSNTHFYSLWAILTKYKDQLPSPTEFSKKYVEFMSQVFKFSKVDIVSEDIDVIRYSKNSTGASTDITQRLARFHSLEQVLFNIGD